MKYLLTTGLTFSLLLVNLNWAKAMTDDGAASNIRSSNGGNTLTWNCSGVGVCDAMSAGGCLFIYPSGEAGGDSYDAGCGWTFESDVPATDEFGNIITSDPTTGGPIYGKQSNLPALPWGGIYGGFTICDGSGNNCWFATANNFNSVNYSWLDGSGNLNTNVSCTNIGFSGSTYPLGSYTDNSGNNFNITVSEDGNATIQSQQVDYFGVPVGSPVFLVSLTSQYPGQTAFVMVQAFDPSSDYILLDVCVNNNIYIEYPINSDANSTCSSLAYNINPNGTTGGGLYAGTSTCLDGNCWYGTANNHNSNNYYWTDGSGNINSSVSSSNISFSGGIFPISTVVDNSGNTYLISCTEDGNSTLQYQQITPTMGPVVTLASMSGMFGSQTAFANLVSFDPVSLNATFDFCINNSTAVEMPISSDPNSTCENVTYELSSSGGAPAPPMSNFIGNSLTNNNVNSAIEINEYPNPAQNVIGFTFKNMDVKAYPTSTISIMDNKGQVIRQKTISDYNMLQMDISDLSAGEYYYQITSGTTILQKNIIIKQ